ncbi:hypothetical protein IQ249_25365 [Lusitaniella coriacea LEGE 07157]|uniref:Uncharacterized protein n=1 Tax=Lusitaniella coriacea LEGE 07157 TaxID=945747 RepID=A0A8J7E114_9CYAN|nr:hypothetical protein [Lusitaniella coriacea]MBE9119183.1 hypothetical protein [Lusitaniella coriacea LEGE 07157]
MTPTFIKTSQGLINRDMICSVCPNPDVEGEIGINLVDGSGILLGGTEAEGFIALISMGCRTIGVPPAWHKLAAA